MPPFSSAHNLQLFIENSAEIDQDVCSQSTPIGKSRAPHYSCRSVGFTDNDEVLIVSRHQQDAIWFTKEGLQSFKRDCTTSVQIIVKGKRGLYRDVCERGLEGMSMAGAIQSKARRKFAYRMVLDEQEDQRRAGVVDTETMARAYQQVTTASAVSALARGKSDADAVNC